jgi:hypothetical protein
MAVNHEGRTGGSADAPPSVNRTPAGVRRPIQLEIALAREFGSVEDVAVELPGQNGRDGIHGEACTGQMAAGFAGSSGAALFVGSST